MMAGRCASSSEIASADWQYLVCITSVVDSSEVLALRLVRMCDHGGMLVPGYSGWNASEVTVCCTARSISLETWNPGVGSISAIVERRGSVSR